MAVATLVFPTLHRLRNDFEGGGANDISYARENFGPIPN